MSFPEKKFKEFSKEHELPSASVLYEMAARWGFAEAERSVKEAYNEGEANGKIIGYDLAVAESCPPAKSLPAWNAGFNAARNEFKSLLAAENRSIRVRAYLTKTQRQLLWLEIQKLNEKVNLK